MDFYSELKSKNDILSVANGLGYNGTRSGRMLKNPKRSSTASKVAAEIICQHLEKSEALDRRDIK